MATTEHILTELGGVAGVARDGGFPMTTVQGWKDSNFIPRWRQDALIELAKKKGKKLGLDDFPTAAERISRKTAA